MISTTQLVERCLADDQDAWQQLIARYARLVHSIPVRHGLTPIEVDDVGQDVFLALAQNLHKIEDPERLPAWLITTAQRLSWRVLQKQKRERTVEAKDLADLPFDPAVDQQKGVQSPTISELLTNWEHQEALQLGFERLEERCCRLLTLIFLDPDEPSYDEISEQMQIAKGSIGPTRNRCLAKLRSILKDLDLGL